MSVLPIHAARPPFVAIVAYTVRLCLTGRRWWWTVVTAAAAVGVEVLAQRTASHDPIEAAYIVAGAALFSLLLPIGCLALGDAALGADLRAGTFPFTWLSPVPFPVIVIGRWLAGWLVAMVVLVPGMVLAMVAGDIANAAPAMALATVTGSAAYVAVFILIGCTAQRAAVWSLGVVFLGERLLGTALSGIAQLSPMWEARGVFAGLAPLGDELHRGGVPEGWDAVVRLLLITVAALAAAVWRMGHLRPAGSGD